VRTTTIASRVTDLTTDVFEAEQALHRADTRLSVLQSERRKAEDKLRELRSDAFKAPEDLVEQTNEWLRSTKHLKAKVAEYDERLASNRANPKPKTTLEDVASQRDALAEQQGRLQQLEMQLQAFQSLPSNPKAARAKLETARDELRNLIQERDTLFAQMAEAG
jgi:HAUS augmin-like complex subunit 1